MYESREEYDLRDEFEGYWNTLLQEAAQDYTLVKEDNVQFTSLILQQFFLFNEQQNASCEQVWSVHAPPYQFFMCLLSIDSTLKLPGYYSNMVKTHKLLHAFGLVHCTDDFGETILRQETFLHRLQNLFSAMETHFRRNRSFSRKYYCLTRDPNLLRKAMTEELMDYLASLSGVELEFHHHYCLFKTEKSLIDTDSNQKMFQIGTALSMLLSANT